MPEISAKVIADSINTSDDRITSMELYYHRYVHSEFMTHRKFSRNASSSRAIPTKRLLEMVMNDPAMPVVWGKNQPGMQAREELDYVDRLHAESLWRSAAVNAATRAQDFLDRGVHKQIVNRLLEPFLFIKVIVTATEFENFFALRDHPDAQPEIRELAVRMREAMNASTPVFKEVGEWHLPYVRDDEAFDIETAKIVSAARDARVSYLNHDGTNSNVETDRALFKRLTEATPPHMSPLEHQATPDPLGEMSDCWGNFVGWVQHRKLIPNESVIG